MRRIKSFDTINSMLACNGIDVNKQVDNIDILIEYPYRIIYRYHIDAKNLVVEYKMNVDGSIYGVVECYSYDNGCDAHDVTNVITDGLMHNLNLSKIFDAAWQNTKLETEIASRIIKYLRG